MSRVSLSPELSSQLHASCASILSAAGDEQQQRRSFTAAQVAARRLPNCTHMDVDREYGYERCPLCYRFPPLGWLYACKQDFRSLKKPTEAEAGPKSELRQQLEYVGLSESVIQAAERNQYTPAQLETLQIQKLRLKKSIRDTLAEYTASQTVPEPTPTEAEETAVPNIDGAILSFLKTPPTEVLPPPPCTFRACYTCRPYFRDRVYMALDSVVENEWPPLALADMDILPTSDARVLKHIGLRPAPLVPGFPAGVLPSPSPSHSRSSSQATYQSTQSDTEAVTRSHLGLHRLYGVDPQSKSSIKRRLEVDASPAWRTNIKEAIKGIFQPHRLSSNRKNASAELYNLHESSSSGSNITLPLPRTGTVRTIAEASSEFDLGTLKLVVNTRKQILEAEFEHRKKERNMMKRQKTRFQNLSSEGGNALGLKTSSSSLIPQTSTTMDTRFSSDDSSYSFASTISEAGSEVEVEGGVALTEEAVETHTPDIITATEVESIMTQV